LLVEIDDRHRRLNRPLSSCDKSNLRLLNTERPQKMSTEGNTALNWYSRSQSASVEYKKIETISPQLLVAITNNLRIWAAILPQQHDDIGLYQPVNSSGLSPEIEEIETLIDELVLAGEKALAGCLRKKLAGLVESAESLDSSAPGSAKRQLAGDGIVGRLRP